MLFNATFTRLTTVDLVNATDFRLLSRSAVDALLSMPEHASFFRGTSSWIGFRRAVVEVDIDSRQCGASRWTVGALCRFYGIQDRIRTIAVSPRYNVDVLYTSLNNLSTHRTEIELTQRQLTTLGLKKPGAAVNLEFDLLAKHVQKLFNRLSLPK